MRESDRLTGQRGPLSGVPFHLYPWEDHIVSHSQRRVDLAVLEDYELRSQLTKIKTLQRMAREMGADDGVLGTWAMHVSDIEAELEMRASEEDVPF